MNKGAVIIPARYESSRFPGKPLADIQGKPMIQHVFQKCADAVGSSNVYIATDNSLIKEASELFGSQVIMTSTEALTGTDRLAEANIILDLDFVVNVQGDEPMASSDDIKMIYELMKKNTTNILNCYCDLSNDELLSPTIPKVIISNSGRLHYMTRGGAPFDKNGNPKGMFKQVCIYGFSREHLQFFHEHKSKTLNELIEDIEILRFLDFDYNINMIKVLPGGVAVDTPEDLERVRLKLKNKI
jgi:3-deoxy-manno-octulosonate cytidylyltransferase (CMP-KDO synthetase)